MDKIFLFSLILFTTVIRCVAIILKETGGIKRGSSGRAAEVQTATENLVHRVRDIFSGPFGAFTRAYPRGYV